MKFAQQTVSFVTLGCKVNQYESDAMAKKLEEEGFKIIKEQELADITIINTCAVTGVAEQKSRQMMSRAKKRNPKTVLVVAGCYVQNMEEALKTFPDVDIFLGNNKKKNIAEYLKAYLNNRERQSYIIDINSKTEYESLSIDSTKEHTRAYVKIQDGCNQFCSYCIIPYVRGRVRSRALEDIVSEVYGLVDKGYKEIVLTGIHISSYGTDFMESDGLLTLILKLCRVEGLKRLRLGSLEPTIITERFVRSIAEQKKVCPHFHLSLQSGCNSTLKRMNRKYTIEQYKAGCELLRRYYHNPAITTDVIVGFPGETDEEFLDTLNNLKQLNLYEIHVFKYSKRNGTNAAVMPMQVDGTKKKQRSEAVIEMSSKQKMQYEQLFYGKTETLLIEELLTLDEKKYYSGHTCNYIKVIVPADEYRELGRIYNVFIKEHYSNEYCLAEWS